jgi:hypothetical protein
MFTQLIKANSMNVLKVICLAMLAMFIIIGSGCKYEEGPALSLRTKKTRLVGEWRIDKLFEENGTEIELSQFQKSITIEFTTANKFIMRIQGDTYDQGMWDFSADKEKVLVFEDDSTNSSPVVEFQILRLKNKELWLKDEGGEVTHFAAA